MLLVGKANLIKFPSKRIKSKSGQLLIAYQNSFGKIGLNLHWRISELHYHFDFPPSQSLISLFLLFLK